MCQGKFLEDRSVDKNVDANCLKITSVLAECVRILTLDNNQ